MGACIKILQKIILRKNLGQKLTLAASLSGGYENKTAPVAIAFNLYSTDDRSVRSGYDKEGFFVLRMLCFQLNYVSALFLLKFLRLFPVYLRHLYLLILHFLKPDVPLV